jgi:hypothetical protein
MCRALLLICLFSLAPLPATAQVLLHGLASPSPEPEGNFGVAVSGVPDTDGDGLGDLLVGASGEDDGVSPINAGRAYVYSGATGDLLHTLRSPNEEEFGFFGSGISGVPDVDGDGRGDLLVGASREGFEAGRAYIYSGATGDLLHELSSPNAEADGFFGSAVSGVGDVDGDGRGDLLVGAWGEGAGPGPDGEGRAYVFSGASGMLLYTLATPYPGEGQFGRSVSGVPDADGDGRGDLFVGAPEEGPGASPALAGRAYVFSGATGDLLYELASLNEELGGQFGTAVSGVQDVDGDGRGDLIVGSWEDPGASPEFAGRVYVFSGASGEPLHTLTSPGEERNGFFGDAVSGLDDVDSDGRGDLLVGAYGENPGTSPYSAGRAYVFSGASGEPLYRLASPNEEREGGFGWPVSGVPDADGDGRGDLLVGAEGEGPGSAGRAYAFSSVGGYTLTADASPEVVTYGDEITITITVSNNTTTPVSADLWLVATRAGSAGSFVERIGAGAVPANTTATRVFVHTVRYAYGGYVLTPDDYTVRVNAGNFNTNTVHASDAFDVTVTADESVTERADGAAATGAASPSAAVAAVTVSPNPVRKKATVTFALTAPSQVHLALYDVLGREVAVLVDGEREAGRHDVALDGARLPAGTYLVRLEAGGEVQTQRLTLVR